MKIAIEIPDETIENCWLDGYCFPSMLMRTDLCVATTKGDFQDVIRGDAIWEYQYQEEDGTLVEGSSYIYLTRQKIIAGLQKLQQDYPKHFDDLIEGQHDAITGSVLQQVILLGDVEYG